MPEDLVGAVVEDAAVEAGTDQAPESAAEGDAAADAINGEQMPKPRRGLFLLGLMIGSAIGAALALLYSPKPDEAVDELVDGLEDLGENGGVAEDAVAPSDDDQGDLPL